MSGRASRAVARGAVLLAGLSAVAGLLAAGLAVEAARLPYDDQGRFFDGSAVHHDDAVLAYAVLAGAAFAVAAGLAGLARRLRKRGQRHP